MRKSRVKSLLLAGLLVGGLTVPAAAASVSTSEFGTFTYNLAKSGSAVQAQTSITKYKSSTRVFAGVEVQINATGQTLGKDTTTTTGKSSALSAIHVNNTSKTLAAFGTHEARGTGSIARYTSRTF